MNFVQNRPAVLYADRSTIRTSTSLTLYYICCRSGFVLLIDLEFLTWQILSWNKIYSTADLLAMCARQLQSWDVDFEETVF